MLPTRLQRCTELARREANPGKRRLDSQTAANPLSRIRPTVSAWLEASQAARLQLDCTPLLQAALRR